MVKFSTIYHQEARPVSGNRAQMTESPAYMKNHSNAMCIIIGVKVMEWLPSCSTITCRFTGHLKTRTSNPSSLRRLNICCLEQLGYTLMKLSEE